MAITSGHGNPRWTFEETVLVLELYFKHQSKIPGPNHPDVISISNLLRSLPYHQDATKQKSFRNADGIVFKLQNLRAVATGQGLRNTSKMDSRVWQELGNKPVQVKLLAEAIKTELKIDIQLPKIEYDSLVDEEDVFNEGRTVTVIHKRKERDGALRPAVIAQRAKLGTLKCEICGFTHPNPTYNIAALEVHHLVPIAELSEQETRIEDTALLCARCHRLIHRAIRIEERWLNINEAKKIILG